jgi:hypothetical protein
LSFTCHARANQPKATEATIASSQLNQRCDGGGREAYRRSAPSQQGNHRTREDFLYELKAGPAGGRLRRPSSAGTTPEDERGHFVSVEAEFLLPTLQQMQAGCPGKPLKEWQSTYPNMPL